jgi:ssDNA-binding Zn-finger/Zn-ribbon topoisomerase 1
MPVPGERIGIKCKQCGKAIPLKWSASLGRLFYGCEGWPNCNVSFDADQSTGAPLPNLKWGRRYSGQHVDMTGGTAAPPEQIGSIWERSLTDDL